MLTAAVILMVVWPGHDIPPMPMQSLQACQRAQFQIAAAAQDYRRENAKAVPGFKVWCQSADSHRAIS